MKPEKDLLLRQLVTKICEEKQHVDLKYEKEFFEEHWMLFQKINSRKKDIPSVKFLQETYKFKAEESEYTLSDIVEKLNKVYYSEATNSLFGKILEAKKNGTYKDTNDILTNLDFLNREFGRIRGNITNSQAIDIANEKEKVVEEYRKLQENVTFIPTGFDYIDEICKPRCGNYLMLCSGSSMGKSLLMTFMQKAAHDAGVPSLYVSLEMTLVEQVNRLLALKGICSGEDLNACKFTPEEYNKFLDKLKDTNTHILTRTTESKINVQTIERYITELKPKVLFLDYLTLLQDSDFSWNSENPVGPEMKRLALQHDLLLVTAVQADASPEVRNLEIPEMHNVRGNKSFPHDANIFIGFVSERKLLDPNTLKFRFAIRKNRNGSIGEFAYEINPNKGRIIDITDSVESGL